MRTERREQCCGVSDFFGREQQQVTAGALRHLKIRRIQPRATRPGAAGIRRLLLRTDQNRGREDDRCRERFYTHTLYIGVSVQ